MVGNFRAEHDWTTTVAHRRRLEINAYDFMLLSSWAGVKDAFFEGSTMGERARGHCFVVDDASICLRPRSAAEGLCVVCLPEGPGRHGWRPDRREAGAMDGPRSAPPWMAGSGGPRSGRQSKRSGAESAGQDGRSRSGAERRPWMAEKTGEPWMATTTRPVTVPERVKVRAASRFCGADRRCSSFAGDFWSGGGTGWTLRGRCDV